MFIIVLLIPSLEIVQIALQGSKPMPNYASYLAAISRGHGFQAVLLWFLPLYFLLIISDDSIEDHKTGYINILKSKIGEKRYYKEKLISSFIVSFTIMLASLLINLLLVHIIFKGGKYYPQEGIEFENNLLFTISMKYPLIANLGFALITSILAGLSGMSGSAFSLFFKDKRYAYTTTFFIWFMLVLRKKSLMLVVQPFAEYGFEVLMPILMLAIFILMFVSVIIYVYEVYYSEN